jgi:hypothetical protein
MFRNKTYTVLRVADNWIFNRIESLEVAVKWKLMQSFFGMKQLKKRLNKCLIELFME